MLLYQLIEQHGFGSVPATIRPLEFQVVTDNLLPDATNS
jgi:hypothetical protein